MAGVQSPFQMMGNFANMPAASAGTLPNVLWATSLQTPLLNSFTPVQTPLEQQLGSPDPLGTGTRPFPIGAFPNAGGQGGGQLIPGSQAGSSGTGIDQAQFLSGLQAGNSSYNTVGSTPGLYLQ